MDINLDIIDTYFLDWICAVMLPADSYKRQRRYGGLQHYSDLDPDSEWVVLIAVGATVLLLGLSTEEHYAPHLLYYKAKRLRELTSSDKFKTAMEASHPSWAGVVRKCFRQPFSLRREPIVIACTLYLTFLDGSA
jgi:hypothetical protein